MTYDTSRWSTAWPWPIVGLVTLCVGGLIGQWIVGDALNAALLRLPGIDKVLHFGAFAVLFVLSDFLLRGVVRSRPWRLTTAFAIGLAVGIAIEAIQTRDPRRNVELADLAANACGLVLGTALYAPSLVARSSMAAAAIVGAGWITYDSHVRTRDYVWGVRAEAQRQYAVARHHYQNALQTGMRSASLYNGLGWVEIESGEGDPLKAVEYARIALAMRPQDPNILDTYGWALLHAGRASDALPYLLEAQQRNPRIYCIHYHLGQTYRRLGRIDDARRELNRQLQRTPNGPDAALAKTALAELESGATR